MRGWLRRTFTTVPYTYEAPVAVERYSRGLSILHWSIAGGIIGAVGCVKLAQNTKDKEWKGRLMNTHKSLALIVLALVPMRLAARLTSKIPSMLPGSVLEHKAASATHVALYGFMLAMPVTGVAMGYYSGFGVPFFTLPKAIKGSATPNKEIAGAAYKVHALAGQALVYFIPLHVGASLFHAFRGQKIFSRVSIFPRA
jgi:cytochrome b561